LPQAVVNMAALTTTVAASIRKLRIIYLFSSD